MNRRQIEILLAIEKFGNVTKAADFVGVTQATVSNFLLKTESKLEARLFYRYSKGMKPTSEGAVFLKTYRNILDQLNQAEREGLSPQRRV